MTLYVLNPNSSASVTDAIDRAIDPLRAWGHPITCLTLAEGPPGIETQAQADRVIAPLLDQAKSLDDATGFVIACFGDPGLHALRDETSRPVVGIQEAAISAALGLGHRFGIVAIRPASIPRHMRAIGAMGVLDRLAGDRAIDMGVTEKDGARERMIAVGRRLRDEDGADVLILGCAGMADDRRAIEDALCMPVVEPCQVGVAQALTRITLKMTHRPEPNDAD